MQFLDFFFDVKYNIDFTLQIKVMEQRASALQARLEARRNMFLKAEQNTYGSNRPTGKNHIVFDFDLVYFKEKFLHT